MAKGFGKNEVFESQVILPATSGYGVQVGDMDGGGEWTWRDITSQVLVRGTGPTDPTWSQIGSTGFYDFKFAENDVCWFNFHIPHDIASNVVHFHTHWITDGTQTRNCTFQYLYAYQKGFAQGAYDLALAESPLSGNAGIVTAQQAATGTPYTAMVTETAAITIPDLTEPDGIIKIAMTRIANGSPGGADLTDGVFVQTADIHYQSTNIGTVNKAPSFYTS